MGTPQAKAVAYYRVSTAAQGRSGLGLDAQRRAVADLCAARGLTLTAEFTEIESGARRDRPELKAALSRAKLTGATLVVAKLDRLSRSVAFLSALQDSGARFIAADMPEVNELVVHILAAVAQAERKAIGQRTRDALAAAKARGTWTKADGTPYKVPRLGNPNGAAALRRAGGGTAASAVARRENADARARELADTIGDLRAGGAATLSELAKGLNELGVQAPRGGRWWPATVARVLERLEPL